MIKCSNCSQGTLRKGTTKDHDIGPLFALDAVLLDGAPALICPKCHHVVLEATDIVRNRVVLSHREVRFLRETIGMTQAELADRLDIIRGTVTRWEAGDGLGPVQSFALRTLAAWALEGQALAQIVSTPSSPKPKIASGKPYRIKGRSLRGAA